MIRAIIFDLDGVLIDSEHIWDRVREQLAEEKGGTWHPAAQREMMGMNSREWAQYMHDRLRVPLAPQEINREVVERISATYRREGLPIIPGAVEAIERLTSEWPLAVASSSNRPIIDEVMRLAPFGRHFSLTVSSEEVTRGKPAPDVYLKAAKLLGIQPALCAGIEDSHNGILAVAAARMRAIAIPNRRYPPGSNALARADLVLSSIAELTPKAVAGSSA